MHADATAAVSVPSDDFFLARQPILGRDQQLLAFELLFRAAGEDEDAKLTDGAAATAAVISHASQLGMEQVVGEQLAFVNVDAVVLMSDFVRFLPPHKVILEILETVKPTPELLVRVAELKDLGFKFAVDDVIEHSSDLDQLVSLIDIIKVDIKGVAPDALAQLVTSLSKTGKRLLAEKVETIDEFKLCMELGFEYFQGYYFARPVILSGRKIAPTEVALLRLLELVNSNADNQAIETAVKRDALISLNLLRLVNSRAVPGERIDTLSQALTVLGRRQLGRWLQILLYTAAGAQVSLDSPLLQLATTRGKLLELMTLRVRPGDTASADRAFTVGIMSLAEALFSVRMADILAHVDIAHDVRDALIDRDGDFGTMLRIAELLEAAEGGRKLNAELKKIGLTVAEVREIELAAFDWVRELTHDVH
ncbi:EAL domain-containing protein [Massilia aurea]|uniref:EAL and HDOD domain-containing protein n=1 Tax=Massilia aurea TaxID=373040 RepID=UPI003462818D